MNLLIRIACLILCSIPSLAMEFWVAPPPLGQATNTGFTTNSPMTIESALTRVESGNTIVFMDGVYPGEIVVQTNFLTLRAQNKWKATIVNPTGPNSSSGIAIYSVAGTHNVTLDGFHVTNCLAYGLSSFGPSNTIKNCWVKRCGTAGYNAPNTGGGYGIFAKNQDYTIVDSCLTEYNGSNTNYDHGIYVGGKGVIVRNNVSRYNMAFGIQFNVNSGYVEGSHCYNNLCYSNSVGGGNAYEFSIGADTGSGVGTNYIYGNTFLSRSATVAYIDNAVACFTNNIFQGGGISLGTYGAVRAGNNLTNLTAANFVYPSRGLFWLTASSSARGNALTTICGPINFFGASQSSVSDIGAFQYSSLYETDRRQLNSDDPNYWLVLSPPTGRTFYIDYEGGSDAYNGTSTNTPWKTHPYMNGAGPPSYTNHLAGDRFIFKGGVTWTQLPDLIFPISTENGGTGANYDYYGVDLSWFKGSEWSRPIFNGSTNCATFVIVGHQYVTVDNFEMKDSYYTGDPFDTAFVHVAGLNNVHIINCFMHRFWHGPWPGTKSGYAGVSGSSNAEYPMSGSYASNCTVVGWNPDPGGIGEAGFPNLYPYGTGSGRGVSRFPLAYNCTFSNLVDGHLCSHAAETIGCNIGPILRSFNEAHGDDQDHPNCIENVGSSDSILVVSNIIHDVVAGSMIIMTGSPGSLARVYNNIFYTPGETYGGQQFFVTTAPSSGTAYIYNNTIYSPQGMIRNPAGWTIHTANNHIIGGSIGEAPTTSFSNLVHTFAQAASLGYARENLYAPTTSSSPTVDKGTNLIATIPEFAFDFLNVPRPGVGGLWDIGAYEFAGQSTTWYVDNAASGANNGTSWADAWTNLASIDWNSIGGGHTIYISGGSTSKIYNEALTVGASGGPSTRIVISVGRDANHNGLAILDAQNTRNYCINLGSQDCVTITGNNGTTSTNLLLRNSGHATDRYTGVGISSSGASGIVVEYLSVTNCNNGLNLGGGDMIIRHCRILGIRGDRAILLDGTDTFDSCRVHNCDIQMNMDASGYGPDGIQGGSGITVCSNHFYSVVATVIGQQHMDACQPIGNHWKIYANLVENMSNAAIEGGSVGTTWDNFLVYNNIWSLNYEPPGWYMRGFEFTPNSALAIVSNIYILNNTCVDLNYRAVTWSWVEGGVTVYNPSITNVVIANNVFYNCGSDVGNVLNISNSTAAVQGDYKIDYNVMHEGGSGKTNFFVEGAAYIQNNPRHLEPTFVSYTARTEGNDFHLDGSDVACFELGTNVSSLMPAIDKEELSRPQSNYWDIGAYELVSTNLPPPTPRFYVVQNAIDLGYLATNSVTNIVFLVTNIGTATVSGNATNPAGGFTLVGDVGFSLAEGETKEITTTFSPDGIGPFFGTVSWTDGTTNSVTGYAYPVSTTTNWNMVDSLIIAPIATNAAGYISQPAGTTVPGSVNSGKAVFGWVAPSLGTAKLWGMATGAGDSDNSFYVTVNSAPIEPDNVWDMIEFPDNEKVYVHQRGPVGSGTYDSPQSVSNNFNFFQGVNVIQVQGREAGARLYNLNIEFTSKSENPILNVKVLNVSP